MPFGALTGTQKIMVLLTLGGAPRFIAGVRASAAAVSTLGRATAASGLAMRTATSRTWAMNQALFTLRRYAFYGTLAIGAVAAGLVKLGVSYLAAKDSAMAALGPESGVFKSTAAFNQEFNKLFQLAKYSPFVIKDVVTAFRVMYPAMNALGIPLGTVNDTMTALTNIMSESGKVTPANFNRISYAIQHMLNQGRLTGRLVQQLSQNGVNMGKILSNMGVATDQLGNISRLNISPINVLNAIIAFSKTGPFKDAAFRISMKSFPGMLAVAKDSLSQFMGVMLGPTYEKFKARMTNILRPTSTLNKIGSSKNAHEAVIALSRAITGRQGLGQGVLLLVSIMSNLALIFIRAVIPAFIIALHTLALFLPILWPLNKALRFLAHHAWLVKYALVPLATWFVIVRGATLGLAAAQFILNLMTFGVLRGFTLWKAAVVIMYAWEGFLTIATWLLTAAFGALTAAEIATAIALAPLWVILGLVLAVLLAIAGAIYLVIKYWKQLKALAQGKLFGSSIWGKIGNAASGGFFKGILNTATGGIGGGLLGFAAEGGVTTASGRFMVGEQGPEIVNLPRGSSITPTTTSPIGISSIMPAGDDRPIIVQLHVSRRVLAEEVARANQDKLARR